LPEVGVPDSLRLVQDITAGQLAGATLPGYDASVIRAIAEASFASGYQWLFLAAALFMLMSTLLTWRLVRSAETPPVSASTGSGRQAAKDKEEVGNKGGRDAHLHRDDSERYADISSGR
jgi:membrane protein implicated in regulation of membrane protease activity